MSSKKFVNSFIDSMNSPPKSFSKKVLGHLGILGDHGSQLLNLLTQVLLALSVWVSSKEKI
jgi:hypothetical protein